MWYYTKENYGDFSERNHAQKELQENTQPSISTNAHTYIHTQERSGPGQKERTEFQSHNQ